MNIVQKVVTFIREVRQELGKVSWSTRQELLSSTIVVIGVTLLMALFIGGVDLLLSKLLSMAFRT